MNVQSKKLPIDTRKAIEAQLLSFPASSARAQLIAIKDYLLEENETIAERFLRDHVSHCHAFRQAMLLVDAGAATLQPVIKNVHCGNGVFKEKRLAKRLFLKMVASYNK